MPRRRRFYSEGIVVFSDGVERAVSAKDERRLLVKAAASLRVRRRLVNRTLTATFTYLPRYYWRKGTVQLG